MSKKIMASVALALISLGITIILQAMTGFEVGINNGLLYYVAAIIFIALSFFIEISSKFFRFLEVSTPPSVSRELKLVSDELGESLESLRSRVDSYSQLLNASEGPDDFERLGKDDIEEVKRRVTALVTERKFETKVKESVEKRLEFYLRQEFQDSINQIVSRLGIEVRELGRRATVNLYIGSVISIVGLVALAIFISMSKSDIEANRDLQRIVVEFMMRLSLVAILQVFAYFFLRLYRQSIYDIKIFQNEITNIQSRNVAVYVGQMSKDSKTLSAIALELSRTERNFILKKGETTVSILHGEQEERYDRAVIGHAERLFDKFASVAKPLRKTDH